MMPSIALNSIGAKNFPSLNAKLEYTDARIRRAVCYAFAGLAGLGGAGIVAASCFGVFQISVLCAAPLITLTAGLIHFASTIQDPSRFEEMHQKYGLKTLLEMFSADSLRDQFEVEIQNPKITFWRIIQTYNLQALLDYEIIDRGHFDLLQDLKERAEIHKNIFFPSKTRHVLTLFANEPEAFKAIIALDAEYKSKTGKSLSPNLPVVQLDETKAAAASQTKQRGYVDAKIKRIVCYAFTILATISMVAVVYFAVFKISIGLAILPVVALVASLHFASKIIDYKDPKEQQMIREQFADSNFVNLYRKHGLNNLQEVFQVDELKKKLGDEIRNPKTTFWNVLRRYDAQELHQTGIISSQHLALLIKLRQNSEPLNLVVYPRKEKWKQTDLFNTYNRSHHVLTAFANEPEAYRMAEALDKAYKAQVEIML